MTFSVRALIDNDLITMIDDLDRMEQHAGSVEARSFAAHKWNAVAEAQRQMASRLAPGRRVASIADELRAGGW